MDRRHFIKVTAVTGASAALASCGNPEHQIIRFMPEESLVPGVAVWKPGLCTLCPAGCGLIVRVMEGDAEIVRGGRPGVIRMGLAKKLEGNPAHPVNRGRLCPRGQAGVQIVYHPDRLRQPLKRSGPRGSGEFRQISWGAALEELTSRLRELGSNGTPQSLRFLTGPLRGGRRELIDRFLAAYGAPPRIAVELFTDDVLRRANALSFGIAQVPSFDLARSRQVVSFSADFLGTWNSPVAQNLAYGEMRQGRPNERARFVQVEPRMSQTGANADEWLPARPGSDGVVALGLAHVILDERLRPASAGGRAGALIEGWDDGLPHYAPEIVQEHTGLPAARVVRLARQLATGALNALLGSVGQPGGLFFSEQPEPGAPGAAPDASAGVRRVRALAEEIVSSPASVQALLVYDANPIYASPAAWRVRQALEQVPFIASFGSFLDETSVLADLILPDHAPLEAWLDDLPESGTTQLAAGLAPPAVRPLHDTRATADVLLDVAHRLGGSFDGALPWQTFEEMLRARFDRLANAQGATSDADRDEFWKQAQARGGWWREGPARPSGAPVARAGAGRRFAYEPPRFDGDSTEYPFHLLPFASQTFFDGSLAHLPWMQEIPDVLSSVMWGSWVEINPRTAERLGIGQGDLVELVSRHGRVEVPALISPGVAPDVVAMPVGQGHAHFTRYASGRGASPVSMLAPMVEPETGTLAWAATRVLVRHVAAGRLVLFAGGLRERPYEHEPR
ncbi:MAG: molybdopterin-dependent oxidoreductase [Acidobacteria bacterium]|nr:molybdopterin-dependent oxidoreductase [Acidobacteriota bacterium]